MVESTNVFSMLMKHIGFIGFDLVEVLDHLKHENFSEGLDWLLHIGTEHFVILQQ